MSTASGGTDEEITCKINKATSWRKYGQPRRLELRKTKLRIFNSNVKYVLLYGSEEIHPQKIQILVDPCQRRFLKIKWSDWVSNGVPWEGTAQELMENQILKRKWRWIGHTQGKPAKNITGQAPARKEEKRSPQKYVEKRYGVRPEKEELHMAPAEKSSLWRRI